MLPAERDVDEFLDSVGEVSRLIEGLKAGTIPPEYVDRKLAERSGRTAAAKKAVEQAPGRQPAAAGAHSASQQHHGEAGGDDASATTEAARQAELRRKLEELKASRARKLRARQLYDSYVRDSALQPQQGAYATDYTQWGLWCPSDEEDELFNSITPNTPEFRAMEQDIARRHERMVEQRQLAERQRQLGNAAFKAGQFSEALRCYEAGLDAQRHSMALHANAALAALKLGCHVQALEHCDKVLHLAEVLHHTREHPLCVKALQRRAAAHQALGQHSKAVADLQAAAHMLPGDAEVSASLERARALQQEHRTARQLHKLVKGEEAAATAASPAAAAATPPAAPAEAEGAAAAELAEQPTTRSSKEYSRVAELQRIQQLVSQLAAAPSPAAAAEAGVAAACDELRGLVTKGPELSVYMRECGGLGASCKLVGAATATGTLQAALQLLNAVCDAPTALEQLVQQQQHALGVLLDLCCHADNRVAAAAADVAYAASISDACRPELCKALLQSTAGAASVRGKAGGSNSRLHGLWTLCCSCSAAPPGDAAALPQRVLQLSLLSNCMVVPAVRTAMLPVLQQQPASLEALLSPQPVGANSAALAAKVYGLCSNMAHLAAVRSELAACQPLTQQLLQAATAAAAVPAQSKSGAAPNPRSDIVCATAALGCLCNLSAEPSVQQQLAGDEAAMTALLRLALHAGSVVSAGSGGTSGSGPAAAAAVAAGVPKLPARGSRKAGVLAPHTDRGDSTASAADAGRCLLLAERAAVLLSRAAKQPCGVALLQRKQGAAVADLVDVASVVTTAAVTAAADEGRTPAAPLQGWLAAAVRLLALLTADGAVCGTAAPDAAAAAIALCCRLLRAPGVQDAVRGNAALLLGHYADDGQWEAPLQSADAVGALVAAARAGRGSATSRNAGITLSRLAARGGGAFLERLRELRGLEVVYEYVKQP